MKGYQTSMPLFDGPGQEAPASIPTAPVADAPRLSRQCVAILARLRQGKANNHELARIALKYTGRLSDLRKAGHAIECFDQDHGSGAAWYRLIEHTSHQ